MKKLFSTKGLLSTLLVVAIIIIIILTSIILLMPKLLKQPSPFDINDFNKAFSGKITAPKNIDTVNPCNADFEFQRGIYEAKYTIFIQPKGTTANTNDYRTLNDGNLIDITVGPHIFSTTKVLFITTYLYQYEMRYINEDFEAYVYVKSCTSPNLNGHKHFLKELAKNINSMVQEN